MSRYLWSIRNSYWFSTNRLTILLLKIQARQLYMVTLALNCAPSGTVMKTKQNSLQIEIGINVWRHFLIPLSMYDFLDIAIDEIIEGVDMLLYQPPHLFPRQTNKQTKPPLVTTLPRKPPLLPKPSSTSIAEKSTNRSHNFETIKSSQTIIPIQGRTRHLKKGR